MSRDAFFEDPRVSEAFLAGVVHAEWNPGNPAPAEDAAGNPVSGVRTSFPVSQE